MTTTNQTTRRGFLKSSAAAAGVFAVPMIIPQRAFGANERILTGHVGVGRQGSGNLGGFMKHAVAVCDVDKKHMAKAAARVEKANGKCEAYGDYRKMLERKDIDAIVCSTPDHWHALVTIDACNAGKDVYCEKPLTLTILEGRKMVEAARANKRIVQTGSQQRSAGNFRTACELVRSGRIGKLQKVLVGIPGPNHPGKPGPDGDPPKHLDYDRWLGPAPKKSYNVKRVHYNFRFFRDYSGGQMTNWGAHHIDIAQWGMGMDNSGPVEIDGKGTYHKDGWHEVTETCRIEYTYASGAVLIIGQREKGIPGGTTFIGSEGTIYVNRGRLSSTPGEIIKQPIGTGDVHLYESGNHKGNFLDCMKTRKLAICDVEIGHRSATICHLGNIACELGRKLKWDPAKEEFVGDKEAQALVSRPYRAPWKI